MNKIESADNINREFQDRDLSRDHNGTILSDRWLNMVQNELFNLAMMNWGTRNRNWLSWENSAQCKEAIEFLFDIKGIGRLREYSVLLTDEQQIKERVLPCLGQNLPVGDYPKLNDYFGLGTLYLDGISRSRIDIRNNEIKLPNTVEDILTVLVDGLSQPTSLHLVGDFIYFTDKGSGKLHLFWNGTNLTIVENLNGPWGITHDGNNTLYYTEADGGRLHSMDTNTRVSTHLTDGLWSPRGMDYYDGVVYIADTAQNQIATWNNGSLSTAFDGLNLPHDIKWYEGEAYVADSGNNRIVRFNRIGQMTVIVDKGLKYPEGIAIENGILYISDSNNNKIKKINLRGEYFELQTVVENVHPIGIRVKDGIVYFVDDQSNFLELFREGGGKMKYIYHGEE